MVELTTQNFKMRCGRKDRWERTRTYLSAGIIVAWCLLPFYWMIATSLRPASFTYETTFFPTQPTLENFIKAMDMSANSEQFPRALLNSIIIGTIVTVIALIFGVFAAYALARANFKGKFLVLGIILGASMFPSVALLSPLFQLFTTIDWVATYQALIIPQISFVLPLTVYTLVSFFQEMPWELEQAALVDGCNRSQAFRKIILPLAAPAMFTTGILAFIASWNEFLLASLLSGNDKSARPVTVAIANFGGAHPMEDPIVSTMAAGTIVTVPLVILVLFFQRKIVFGLTAGAVK